MYAGVGVLVIALFLSLGCTETAEPRAQLLVIVDTNTPVVTQAAEDPGLSADAAVDTLRIDFLESDEKPREIVAPDPRDWPISFGIIADRPTTLRLRLFRASRVQVGAGDEPIPDATIDRIVELSPSADGVKRVRVTLDGECMGTRPVFTQPVSTCVSKLELGAPPSTGLVTDDATLNAPSMVGTWDEARARPCVGPAKPGRICIPGGFLLLGDRFLVGLQTGVLDAAPMHPVIVAPFWMDETELTVGRFRSIAAQVSPPPDTAGPGLDFAECKWIDAQSSDNDAYPLNCITHDAALASCSIEGGTLPSEAQWEHVARGRGQARRYPWGDAPPECCTTSYHRAGMPGPVICPGTGPEEVGSHATNECPDHDVSRDGILDLGGSVAELTLDSGVPFTDECWEHAGIPHNPVCTKAGVGHILRGGNWGSGVVSVQSAVRLSASLVGPLLGFRCVYEDKP